MLTNCNITASNDSVISCDNIPFNQLSKDISLLAVTKKLLTRKFKEYYPRLSADSKNTADLHLQVDASADRTSVCTSMPTLPPTSLDHRLLLSKYRTISRYHDIKCHNISISLLGYDMNPSHMQVVCTNFLLILKQFSQRYNKKFQGLVYFETQCTLF